MDYGHVAEALDWDGRAPDNAAKIDFTCKTDPPRPGDREGLAALVQSAFISRAPSLVTMSEVDLSSPLLTRVGISPSDLPDALESATYDATETRLAKGADRFGDRLGRPGHIVGLPACSVASLPQTADHLA
jgi:hypothetical protein